ncbi:MAG: selenocysteine-specific translation elongation factor, partial [Solirubrobacteraceae bacterium]
MSPGPLTLGTAGHIDHGKTALIRALTGVDTDRLPEERARGISIELGYASLELPSGRWLSVIDVPGHERFVRTMVAGATGIDLYLMTVAADDGVMPQTREHAAVLRALAVSAGVVAITKTDLAEPEDAILEAAQLLPGVPAVPVCARTGEGLAELREALDRMAAALPSRGERAAQPPRGERAAQPPPTDGGAQPPADRAAQPPPARLHVDRVFTIRGAGTVVTGTLWSGEIARGDRLEILPQGRGARVRGVQVHDQPVDRAAAGQRVAVNLSGVALREIARGDVLASPAAGLRRTHLIDAQLEFGGGEPQPGERVQIHHGTRESPARLAELGGRCWQLRLEAPLVPAPGDRLVVRRIAPPDTLGGGVVLDAHPRKHGPSREALARLTRLARGEPASSLDVDVDGTRTPVARERGSRRDGAATQAPLGSAENPQLPHSPAPLTPGAIALELRLRAAGIEPPLDGELDPDDLRALRAAGGAVRVSRHLHYHPDVVAEVRERAIALARRHDGALTLAQLRDELHTSRKFAQALLEHLDAERVTIRRGEHHFL